jgi:hypothetical protein
MSPLPPGGRPDAPAARYEIRVRGVLDDHWSAWFEGLELRGEPGGASVLAGPVADQSALYGLLARVADLGLVLLSVRRSDPEQEPERQEKEESP